MGVSGSQPQHLTIRSLAARISTAKNLVLVCGAGLSHGTAPLAQSIEDGMLAAICRLGSEAKYFDQVAAVQASREIKDAYLTLELLVSGIRHRVPALKTPLSNLYQELFHLERPNRSHVSLGKALGKLLSDEPERSVTILTSNFDNGITLGLDVSIHRRFITEANVAKCMTPASTEPKQPVIDICAYHGTVDQDSEGTRSLPTTVAARDLAHPFTPHMSEFISNVLEKADLVLFIGHRGEDYYDFNIVVHQLLQKAKNVLDKERVKSRFLCIPHMGRLDSVSDFYERALGPSGLVVLDDGSGQWVAELFDAVSGSDTSRHTIAAKTAASDTHHTAERMYDLVHKEGLSSDARTLVAGQCAALIKDIAAGVLAAWSVIEHYRLESIGYEQDVISVFARPSEDRKFYDIPLTELVRLQKDYQAFRAKVASKPAKEQFVILADGIMLTGRLEKVGFEAMKASEQASPGVHRSIVTILASIAFDYAGLVAMRLMKLKVPDNSISACYPDLNDVLKNVQTTSALAGLNSPDPNSGRRSFEMRAGLLFDLSIKLALKAGDELEREAGCFHGPGDELKAYQADLGEIVPWRDWEMAPAENRLRLEIESDEARLIGFLRRINLRMDRIAEEMDDDSHRSFSATGHAAQCAQRLAEAMRLITGADESGVPDNAINAAKKPNAQPILSAMSDWAIRCMNVVKATSSLKNYRVLSAYDALVLLALTKGQGGDANRHIAEAREYAQGEDNQNFTGRLAQVQSRVVTAPVASAA